MNYQYYKNRVLRKGSTNQERIIYEKKRSFEEYLNTIPNAYEVNIDGNYYLAAIQDVSFNNENSEMKYLLTYLDTPLDVGSTVVWDDKNWIVISKEVEAIKSHQSCKIALCNNILTFQDTDNPSIIYEIPCILTNKASTYSSGEKETKYIVLADDQILVTIPNNDITKKISLDKRFIFDNSKFNIYKTTKIDTLSQRGLINITMKKDEYNSNTDRLDLNIADYINIGEEQTEPPTDDGYVIEIEGADSIAIFGIETYTAKIYYNGELVNDKEVRWEISDRFNIKETTDTAITLEVPVGDYTTGNFILKAILVDDESIFAEKTILVTAF